MKPFMEKFLLLLSDDFEKRGIAIEIFFEPEAQWGYADPRALQQVMLNIMSNASDAVDGKHSPRILIKVSKVDNKIRIRVTDNGCGILEEQQKKLFSPFFTTKASGTGLGLVIAKKLLSQMNGIIEIKSRRDEGTSVEILIQEEKDEH
jgi:C4-dicarboxylate-specific signal transduction histidine kinase